MKMAETNYPRGNNDLEIKIGKGKGTNADLGKERE